MKIAGNTGVNLVIVFLGAALVVFFAGVCVVIAVNRTPPTQLWAAGGAITGALVGVLMPSPGAGSVSAASATAADATHAAALDAARASAQAQTPDTQAAAQQAVDQVRGLRTTIHATNARLTRGQGPAAAAATGAQTTRLTVQALADSAQTAVQRAQQAVQVAANASAGQPPDPQAAVAANTVLAGALAQQTVLQSATTAAADATEDATTTGIGAAKSSTTTALRTIWFLAVLFIVFLAVGVLLETANATTHPAIIDAGKAVIALASSAGAALVALFAPEPAGSVAGAGNTAGASG